MARALLRLEPWPQRTTGRILSPPFFALLTLPALARESPYAAERLFTWEAVAKGRMHPKRPKGVSENIGDALPRAKLARLIRPLHCVSTAEDKPVVAMFSNL